MKKLRFIDLLQNPPKFKIEGNEVIMTLVSAMCDNQHTWKFKRNSEGNFKISTCGFAYRNFQTKFEKWEIEWEADEGNWNEVISMINSGTSRVGKVRCR